MPDARVLKMDGRLSSDDPSALLCACGEVAARLALHLTDPRSADRRGVDVLRRLRAGGVDLLGLSPCLESLLSGVGPRGT